MARLWGDRKQYLSDDVFPGLMTTAVTGGDPGRIFYCYVYCLDMIGNNILGSTRVAVNTQVVQYVKLYGLKLLFA